MPADCPPPVHVTQNAVQRYQERVAAVDPDQARAALDCPAARTAAAFGAPFVRLPGGQRLVLCGDRVVTVLPQTRRPGTLSREWTDLHR